MSHSLHTPVQTSHIPRSQKPHVARDNGQDSLATEPFVNTGLCFSVFSKISAMNAADEFYRQEKGDYY